MDNTALARFITSFGCLNGYGSSVAQTKKALDDRNTKPLEQSEKDIGIFKDALAGIAAIKKNGFSVDGIIVINKAFVFAEDEDPEIPGHLRNSLYNTDDNISIIVDKSSSFAYFPPEVVTRRDLEMIVNDFNSSKRTERDAWQVFARLSKLQPFQDGNKRTALIAANGAMNVWNSENYLVLPFNDLDRVEYMVNLMRYYQAETPEEEDKFFSRMMRLLPSSKERAIQLHNPVIDPLVKTHKVKTTFKTNRER